MFDRETWKNEFSQQLEIGEKAEVAKFKRYYNEQYKAAIDGFLLDNNPRGGNNLFKSNELENLYIGLYTNIGLRFAKWYAKSFDRLISKKQDVSGFDDVWSEGFADAGRKVAGKRIVLVQGTAKAEIIKNLQRLMKDPEFMALGAAERGRILRSRFNKLSAYQAERIVRTEATYAANLGSERSALDMFGASGLQKEWLTAIDGRERDAHRMANGQVVDMDKPFNVGGELLMIPGDPRGRASNVINCRCAVAHIPKPDAQPTTQLEGFEFGMAARTVGLESGELVGSTRPTKEVVSELLQPVSIKSIRGANAAAKKLGLNGNFSGLDVKIAEDYLNAYIDLKNKFPQMQLKNIGSSKAYLKNYKDVITKQVYQQLKKYESKINNEHMYSSVRKEITKIINKDFAKRIKNDLSGGTIAFYGAGGSATRGFTLRGNIKLKFKFDFSEVKGIYHNDFRPYQFQQLRRTKNVESGWTVPVNDPKLTMYHEFGHLLDDQIKFSQSDEFKSLVSDYSREKYSKEISRYATSYDDLNDNYAEIIAEAWAEYQLSENPRPKAIAIGKEIERQLKRFNKNLRIIEDEKSNDGLFIFPPDIFDEDDFKEKIKRDGHGWWKN